MKRENNFMNSILIGEFEPFFSFEYLHEHGYGYIPNENGLYIVCIPLGFEKRILLTTTAMEEYQGRCLLYLVEELENKWIENCNVLYIGKADGNRNHLRNRIRQFVKYAYAEVNNHRGGRSLWQLEDNKSLLIGWRSTLDASNAERQMILSFEKEYQQLPFANRHH